jgi:hypothetical protein
MPQPQLLRTTYDFKTKFEIKKPTFVKPPGAPPYYRGPGLPVYPSDDELIAEVKTVMANNTMKVFQEEMIKQGVTDFKLMNMQVNAHVITPPHAESPGLFQGMKYYVEVEGQTIIEYEDSPLVLVAAILTALTAFLVAHPVLIVAGLAFLAALAAVAVFNATVTNISQNTTEVIDALSNAVYKNTQSTGGTLVLLTALVLVVIVSFITAVLVFPDAFKWMRKKGTGAWDKARNYKWRLWK